MNIYYLELGGIMLTGNLTVRQVAKECHVTTKTVYNWLNKVSKPKNINKLNKLASVLNVDVEVLKEFFKD